MAQGSVVAQSPVLEGRILRQYGRQNARTFYQPAQSARRRARSAYDRCGGARKLLYPFRGRRPDGTTRGVVPIPAVLCRLCRGRLLFVPPLPVEVALRVAARPDEYRRAATVLAVSLLVLDYVLVAPNVFGQFFFGKITIVLYWLLQMVFLGAGRIGYRYFRYTRTRHHSRSPESNPTLVLGRAADAEVLLRAIESGAVKKIWPVGILSPSSADQGQAIRGIPVLGNFEAFDAVVNDLAQRGTTITRVIFTPSALDPEAKPEATLMHARRLGLTVVRLPSLDDAGETPRLAPVNVEDLLLRPTVKIDYARLESFLKGRSIVVTGGGGSIGAEICDRVVTFGAARVLIIENSEPALHAVLEALATKRSQPEIIGRIADVRDRARLFRLMGDFKPDIVFHAAALKHVPLLEQNWEEGVKTNVLGSVNVADAAAAAGAAAMVMISTDKAIEPVSVLGATKRFAEMYCQALDADLARRAQRPATDAADRGAVRQCARLKRLGGSQVQGADRCRRPCDRHPSGHGALFHDHSRSLRSRRDRRQSRAWAGALRRLGLCAQHGPAGEDRGPRRTHDPARRSRAWPRYRHRFHRHASGRADAGSAVCPGRADGGNRGGRRGRGPSRAAFRSM